MEKCNYLIIGNGIAGLAAIREIRKKDKEGSISVVSNEGLPTYYRTKLTKYTAESFRDVDLLVATREWYQDNHINLLLNKVAQEIDTKNKTARLDDQTTIAYEKLLLATGSRPFIPPITGKSKEGVFAMRTINDLHDVKNHLDTCAGVVVIGGGLLGLEAAWSLKKLGKDVSIVEFAPYLLPRQLDEEVSKQLYESLEKEGFKIYLNAQTEEVIGETKVERIRLKDGKEIEAGAVIISVGIRPNLDLIKETKIAHDKGIIVDKHLKTNIDNIYAAGDVAEIDHAVLGLWTVSNAQGQVAGANMVGGQKEFIKPNMFTNLEIGPIKLFSAGVIDHYDKVYEDKDDLTIKKIFVKDEKIVGTILFGDLKEMNKIRKAVFSNLDINEFLEKNNHFSFA